MVVINNQHTSVVTEEIVNITTLTCNMFVISLGSVNFSVLKSADPWQVSQLSSISIYAKSKILRWKIYEISSEIPAQYPDLFRAGFINWFAKFTKAGGTLC